MQPNVKASQVVLSSAVQSPAWPALPPNGWSWPAFALGAIWYLRQGISKKGRVLLVPQVAVTVLAIINTLFLFRQLSFPAAVPPAIVGSLILWSFVGCYCAASFRGDAYRRWCEANGQMPLVPTQWQWGAFLLTGGWYVAQGMRVKGLWLWLAFFTSVGSVVGIPIGYAIMCYCGGNSRADRFLENPPVHIGPTPQEHWIHQDVLRALTPVAKTPQASLRASLLEAAVRGLRRQGYAVALADSQDEGAASLTLERGARFLAVRVVPELPVPASEVVQLVAALEGDAHKVGVLVVNGPLSGPAQSAAEQAHVRVLNVQAVES